ncbi:MAG: enolase C-terminal domain-like protein [Thermodesulfobacteriota bacterium]
MQIRRINLYSVVLPFVGDFSHSLKKGASAANVVAEVVCGKDGPRGYGESAPRPYVTGETPRSVLAQLTRLAHRPDFPWDLEDISQVRSFVAALPAAKSRNAAICAIETALLDALGKIRGVPVLEFFPKSHRTDRVVYGAAIHLGTPETISERCRIIRRLGIRQVRVKMDRDLHRNRQTIETVLAILGPDCDLRIDVNGAWDDELALKHIPLLKAGPVRVVEQPLGPASAALPEFAAEMQSADIRLMADESACDLGDMDRILAEGFYDMINVRLSKCGGFHRSLAIIDFLRRQGLYFQIGCQLGESGLLSAAGRTLALLCKDALYVDGSYDKLLLKENLTIENVSFGPGGLAGPLTAPGLGVRVNPQQIERLGRGLDRETLSRP